MGLNLKTSIALKGRRDVILTGNALQKAAGGWSRANGAVEFVLTQIDVAIKRLKLGISYRTNFLQRPLLPHHKQILIRQTPF